MPNVNKYVFSVTSRWSLRKRKKLKSGSIATATSLRSIGPQLTKICRKWRNIQWFMDWVWTSFLGLTTRNLSENWFRRWLFSNPHPPGCAGILEWEVPCEHPEEVLDFASDRGFSIGQCDKFAKKFANKFCSSFSCKWNVMFDARAAWRAQLLFWI